MSELSTLARPYAEAVFRLAKEAGDLAAWSERLALIAAIAADARVDRLIGDPTVPAERIAELIISVAGDALGEKGQNFVKLLAANGRLGLIAEIVVQFERLKAEDEGVLEARIVSALPLTEAQIAALTEALKARFERRVNVTVAVDESLIGGAVIAIGDKVIDGSVKGRLERMASTLQA
jgi:F-type H+-transporting ATPase subunit delta